MGKCTLKKAISLFRELGVTLSYLKNRFSSAYKSFKEPHMCSKKSDHNFSPTYLEIFQLTSTFRANRDKDLKGIKLLLMEQINLE